METGEILSALTVNRSEVASNQNMIIIVYAQRINAGKRQATAKNGIECWVK